MFDARAVLGIVLYFKEKILKPLRKDGYLNRCNLPEKKKSSQSGWLFSFFREAEEDANPSECDSPVDCSWMAATQSFSPKAKKQTESFATTIKPPDFSGNPVAFAIYADEAPVLPRRGREALVKRLAI